MSDILVEIVDGKLRGTTGQDYYGGKFYKFLGVPYAKAPVGELRFKAPQPPDPWTEIRDATKEGPECPSHDLYFAYYVGREDNCLNLNVFTKELPANDDTPLNKPVMVWIHGGAFVTGCNKSLMFGPDYLMTQDIVLVMINYRLGILGFASFKDQSLDVPGNAGLKDQRLALKWVQRNIRKFGGDPGNVTVFGESAGAASLHYLTLSPSTQGLFHKAIIQSGSALNNWAWGKNNASEIASCLGYKETDEKRIFEKLKRESAKSIVNSQRKIKEHFQSAKIRPWGPVVEPHSEHAILTEHPTKIMHTRGGHKIPVIMGYNSGEGIFYELVRKTVPGLGGLPKDLEHEIPLELGLEKGHEKTKEVCDKLKQAYFGDNHPNEDAIDEFYKLKGDTNFIHSIQRTMKLQAKHSQQPLYAYRMSLVGPLNYFHFFSSTNYFKTTMLVTLLGRLSHNYLPPLRETVLDKIRKFPRRKMDGVVHADDLLYLFPTFYTPKIVAGSPEDVYIQRFVKLWTNFARHGDPTPEPAEDLNRVKWRPVRHDKLEFLDIGHELKMIENIDGTRLKLLDELYETHLKIDD